MYSPIPATARRAAFSLISVAALFVVGGAAEIDAQSALDGFDPNANGVVEVVVVQPDGKILLGGDFTTLSPNGGAPVTRNRIARLNPDGTLDTAFNPNANGSVRTIAVQTDGKILAGGDFNGANSIGGQARNRIARLDATTGLADSFDPNADLLVFSIAVQADGRVLAGGDFTIMGGQTRNHIARLNTDGSLDMAFNPNANGFVSSIVVQADGKILAGGDFSGANSIGGQTRNFIARLDPATGLADSFNPNANLFVRTIAIQADGKILAGGYFNGANSIGGQARNRIARLDPSTGLADSFDPNANNIVRSITVQPNGKILVGGFFSGTNSIGGQTRNFMARLDPTSGLADSFNPKAGSTVFSIAVQADGKILAGGAFTTLTPNGPAVTRNGIARLEIDGYLDQTLDVGSNDTLVTTTAVQPDGKIIVGGLFTTYLGVERIYLARLNTDGTIDRRFSPNPDFPKSSLTIQPDAKILMGGYIGMGRLNSDGTYDGFDPFVSGTVYAVALQADGKVWAGGDFTSIGGKQRGRIARLQAFGATDSPNPNANNTVRSIAVQPDGKILVGGDFTAIGGQSRNGIARIDPNTGLADSFNPDATGGAVLAIVLQPDGKILVGGNFTSIGGQLRNRLARLDPVSGLADSFNPNANDDVFSLALQADGKILVGGDFTTVGGQNRGRIARLDGVSGLADSFNPNAPTGDVFAVVLQADGKVLAGGNFFTIGGQTRTDFARLSNDIAALQDLAVTQTTVTWTRGGSSPQFTRVIFEQSTDGVNYTALGDGTSAGSNWTLTGLNLPVGQNLYIRGRGLHSSGANNGSTSLMESVRNVYIAGPAATPTPTPTATPSATPTATVPPTPTPVPTPCATIILSENFDGVIPPDLPAGWVATNAAGPDPLWATSATNPDTAPNDVFVDDPDEVSDKRLDVELVVPSAFVQLRFRNSFNLEFSGGTYWDGAVLEISSPNINAGAYTDITDLATGATVVTGGYNATLFSGGENPLRGRSAWSGNSNGYIKTVINLGAHVSGQTIKLRFRLGSDEIVSAPGWRIDTITITDGVCPTPTPFATPTPSDFGGSPSPPMSPSPTPSASPPPTPTPTPTPTPSVAPPVSPTPSPTTTPAAQSINLSTRMRVETGDNAAIGGFIITGTAQKHVLLRAIGPSLTLFGVPNVLADPVLELHGPGAFVTVTNDDWRDDPIQEALIKATGIPPSNNLESAIDATLASGAYTAIVRGKANTSGVALVEVYDLNYAVDSKLANISTRAFVSSGDDIVIGGFLLGGRNGDDKVVVRGLGPSLTALGVPGALADPKMELRNADGALLIVNNDWQDDPTGLTVLELVAAGLAPTNPLESAIVAVLPPGLYTTLLSGVNNGTGVGLVEIYDRGVP